MFDPQTTWEYSPFPEDDSKSDAEKRYLICRAMSVRDWERFDQLYEAAWNVTNKQHRQAMMAMLAMVVVGFRNMTNKMGEPVAWTGPESLPEALSVEDAIDIHKELEYAATPSLLDKKKSMRQSRTSSAAADSAPSAQAMGGASIAQA